MRITLALFAMTAFCLQADEWNRSYSVGANPELDVRVDDANVTVRAGSSGSIQARIASQGYEFKPGDVTIRDAQQGNRVEIEVKRDRQASQMWGNDGNRWIRVELTVPAQLAASIKTGDGNVDVSGVSGDLRFVTGDGNVVGDGIGGSLETGTGDGNVKVSGRFRTISATTGDGNIDIRALPGSETGGSWQFSTGDGNVRLYLPTDLRATVDARTGDGRIETDLPLAITSASRRDRDDSELRGSLNGGGPSINLRTGDGNIFLSAAR